MVRGRRLRLCGLLAGRLLFEVLDLLEETPARRALCDRLQRRRREQEADEVEALKKMILEPSVVRALAFRNADGVVARKMKVRLAPLAVDVVGRTMM